MDWGILAGVTAAASLIVALVAVYVARRITRSGGEPGFMELFLAILISLAVLQGAAKLAIIVGWAFDRAGIDRSMALGGQIGTVLFGASFVPIAAYVVTFLMVVKKGKG